MSGTDPLWDWAVRLYGRPGVAEACLALQDEAGADVPLALWALWRHAHGRPPDAACLAAAESAVGLWREEVVKPLRTLRRRLKNGPPPAPDAESAGLRERVKAAELEAERIELSILEVLADQGSDPADARALLERTLRLWTDEATVMRLGDRIALVAAAAN